MTSPDIIKRNPTLTIQGGVAAIIVAQLATIPMPEWAHSVVAFVVIVAGAFFNRSKVSPG